MRRLSNLPLFLMLVIMLPGGAGVRSQQPAQPTSQTALQPRSEVLHKRTAPPSRTIFLDVVVTRKPGQAVTGLTAKDFTLLDNKRPKKITSFAEISAGKEPVEAIVLIDSVNTDYDVVAQVRQQLDKFLLSNGGKLPLPTALAVLANRGVQMQGSYSTDGKLLDAALTKYTIGLREIRRSAGVVGAAERLDDSLNAMQLLTNYERQRPGRKIILWISPGWPLLSGPSVTLSYDQTVWIFNKVTWYSSRLRQAQVTVYSIDPLGVEEPIEQVFYYQQFLGGVKRPGDAQLGNLGLQVVATETGGRVMNSPNIAELLSQCMADNLDYYRISFEPPAPVVGDKRRAEAPDVYHELKVLVAQPGVTVSSSTGYYLQP